MKTPNEQLQALLPRVRARLARAKFLHETWLTLPVEDVELLHDAGEEFLRDLILPGDESPREGPDD